MITHTHELKCWPEFFEPTLRGDKTYECRKDDRPYGVGDTLLLREFKPCVRCNGTGKDPHEGDECMACCGRKGEGYDDGYTGRVLVRQVSYVMRDTSMGLQPGYCLMGLRLI